MYAGGWSRSATRRRLREARHPYTRALVAAAPDLDHPRAVLRTVARDPSWAA